jgi:hypothetical protein
MISRRRPWLNSRSARWSTSPTRVDDRTGIARVASRHLRKLFPDHRSFMLGEMALWRLMVLLVTGGLLTLWFKPRMTETDL